MVKPMLSGSQVEEKFIRFRQARHRFSSSRVRLAPQAGPQRQPIYSVSPKEQARLPDV